MVPRHLPPKLTCGDVTFGGEWPEIFAVIYVKQIHPVTNWMPRASYSIQPSSLMAQPAFQILVTWLILPSSNSIT